MPKTAEEVIRAVDEGFLAGVAEQHLRALAVWEGCPYPEGTTTAIHWRSGYEAGWIVRRQAEACTRSIPDP